MNLMVTQPTARHTGENATEAAFRRQVTALKDGVRIEEVAAEYGNFRPTGTSWLLGRCLSPSHEDRTPSMTIYTDRQKFRCYSCGERGDVIDLEMLVNPGMEIQEAMVSLSLRYGVPLPERSRAWFDRQTRQAPIRERIEAEKVEHVRELVYRLVFAPWLRRLPESTRQTAADSAWRESRNIARMVYARRRGA